MPLSEFSHSEILDFLFIGAIIPEEKKPHLSDGSKKDVLEIIRMWLYSFTKSNQNWALKLSGGLDSRLILFLLKEMGIKHFKVHTYYNPELGIDLDADVYCAKAIIKELEINADHQLKPGYPDKYLLPFDEKIPEISGIFGTEVLGGVMFDQLPLLKQNDEKEYDILLSHCPSEYRERLEKIYQLISNDNCTSFFLNIFTKSPLAQFYDSNYPFGWSSPNSLREYAHSPYVSDSLINLLHGMTQSELKDYKFYDQIIKDYKSYLFKVPLISDYTNYFEAPIPNKNYINSKSVPFQKGASQEMNDKELIKLANKYQIKLDHPKLINGLRKLLTYQQSGD